MGHACVAPTLAAGEGPAGDLEHLETLPRGPLGDLLERQVGERRRQQPELHGFRSPSCMERPYAEPLSATSVTRARPPPLLRAEAGREPVPIDGYLKHGRCFYRAPERLCASAWS